MSKKSFTLKELAEFTDSTLLGDPCHVIEGVSDLESADVSDVSFLGNLRYKEAMLSSKAGAVFVDQAVAPIAGRNFLVTDSPSAAFQKTVEAFFDGKQKVSGFSGIHPTAVIHKTAKIGHNATVSPHAVIDEEAVIGDNVFIGPGCSIGPCVSIGADSTLYANVTVRENCSIGKRVTLQPGVVIGACGFGYITDAGGQHIKLKQLGNVVLEDDVEIGANTCIDRARFKTTTIRRGTKIDNLVQIGHGVSVGEDNLIIAQAGIAGSTKTGKNVVLAGHVAVAGHLTLADRVTVTGFSGVSKSLVKSGFYGGIPAVPLQEHNRTSVFLRNIEKYVDRIKKIEEKTAQN